MEWPDRLVRGGVGRGSAVAVDGHGSGAVEWAALGGHGSGAVEWVAVGDHGSGAIVAAGVWAAALSAVWLPLLIISLHTR